MNETTQGTKTKLSQWEALMLESLRGLGWSDEEMIERVIRNELPQDDSKFQFDYTALATLANEQQEIFISAVKEGYTIKYNTIRGIHSWILLAFQQDAQLVLEPAGAEAIYAELSESEAKRLADVLSFGWEIKAVSRETEQPLTSGKQVEPGKQTYEIKPIAGN